VLFRSEGEEREYYHKIYLNACEQLKIHPDHNRFPQFENIMLLKVKGKTKKVWGRCIHPWTQAIEISEEFLKAFGDKEDIVEHLFKHELAHFLVREHRRWFKYTVAMMEQADIHTYRYIRRIYGDEFIYSRWDICKGIAKGDFRKVVSKEKVSV
jgi:predicted metal-dependent hydrolase